MWKIGDRVEVIECNVNHDIPKLYEGLKGKIIDFMDNKVLIEFDENVCGHDGIRSDKRKGRKGHCWWFWITDEQYTEGVPIFEEVGIKLTKVTSKKNNYW